MNLLYLALIGLGLFLILALLRKWFDTFILIAFCIGALCNANYYNAVTCPVQVGDITFGIDSILYTIFLFTIVIKYLHYSVKEAKNMAAAAIVAVVFAAFIEFFAKLNSNGFDSVQHESFLLFLTTAGASLIAVFLMVLFLENTKSWNVYPRIAIAILIGSLVNSTLYYFFAALIQGGIQDNLIGLLVGSYIGKIYSIGLSLLLYWFNGRVIAPTDLKKKNYHDLEK